MSPVAGFAQTSAIILLLLSCTASIVVLPSTNGPYNTTISTVKLVDQTRLDPYAPTRQARAIMVSLFRPVDPCRCSRIILSEYMPPTTAAFEDAYYGPYGIPNGTFASLRIQQCHPDVSTDEHGDSAEYPVVIFSPGSGNSRLLYNAIAQSVASAGFVVITVDHPYDGNIVEYPDGSFVLATNITTDAQYEFAVRTRALDISFVLDQLSNSSSPLDIHPWAHHWQKVTKAGVFGHSIGGATAAAAMLNDNRIAGGLNLDGEFFGPVIKQGLDRAFMIFGRQGKSQKNDPTWASIWRHLRGWKVELALADAQHGTFTDLPLLVNVTGLASDLPGTVDSLLGTLSGPRVLEILGSYTSAFFTFVLRDEREKLLLGPAAAYPEVSFVA